jgi:hypothetical protein
MAQQVMHVGGANGSKQVEYVASLRDTLAKDMQNRFVLHLKEDEIMTMTEAGISFPKFINRLLKLEASFFVDEHQPADAPAHFFRSLCQDSSRSGKPGQLQPILSGSDQRDAIDLWLDLLEKMQVDTRPDHECGSYGRTERVQNLA